ncbi:hypothetical protein E4T56_gene11925 [Termitomyces sp. T112]|nr:hypothetical protein E4T56_gene11925 [Termitomyces sp. T112]
MLSPRPNLIKSLYFKLNAKSQTQPHFVQLGLCISNSMPSPRPNLTLFGDRDTFVRFTGGDNLETQYQEESTIESEEEEDPYEEIPEENEEMSEEEDEENEDEKNLFDDFLGYAGL